MKFYKKYVVTVFFALFIVLFSITDMITSDKVFSELENRYLQQKPVLSISALIGNNYTMKFEEYINDQFLLRDSWITLKSRAEYAFGKLENNGVVYGADGYLFAREKSVDEKRLAQNVTVIYDFMARFKELDPALMLVPSSYAMMPDKLPRGLNNFDQIGAIDGIYRRITSGKAIQIADALLQKQNQYIYYRTDHHWTSQGAYIAYQQYMNAIGYPAADFSSELSHRWDNFYGTYYAKAKRVDAKPDTVVWYDVPGISVTVDGKPVDGLYDLSQIEKKDKYGMFLYGNNGLTVTQNSGGGGNGETLLIVKDSYANCIIPYLVADFDKIVVVDLRYFTESMDNLISESAPDHILVLYGLSGLSSDTHIGKLAG